MEETAFVCLEELAQRSMVHVHSRDKIRGCISGVQMHDVVREWAIQQSRKEGFLKMCKNQDDVSDGIFAYRFSLLEFFDDRICISTPNVRSMLGFGLPSVTLGTLRFLRTLYMSDSNLEKISKVIGRLIHLRFIGLKWCKSVVLPSSTGQLLNLQSIDLTGTDIPCVPKSLWDIPTLRHVVIPKVETNVPTTVGVDEQSNLQTLCIHRVGHKSLMRTRSMGCLRLIRSLMHMPQLRTLALALIFYRWTSSPACRTTVILITSVCSCGNPQLRFQIALSSRRTFATCSWASMVLGTRGMQICCQL
ncbi:hypothetical protein PAHAL_3G292200 [Panicum hallii]|uniref:Disease resistance R13L4/SHOC-2-like LRR domain-containing protein n=1 Tax=Panicum hallii TaxID=206008 RepID=A0A2T8KJW1_9POAL|nr:hypothetical protein PAHAL_3G292200 [Panicum hallii]